MSLQSQTTHQRHPGLEDGAAQEKVYEVKVRFIAQGNVSIQNQLSTAAVSEEGSKF